MKRLLPHLILLCAVLWLAKGWFLTKPPADDFDITSFGRLPVLEGGRIKPLDTIARNALLIMRGKQTLSIPKPGPPSAMHQFTAKFGLVLPNSEKITASRWLADVMFKSSVADTYPVFAIANPDLLSMCGLPKVDKHYASFDELRSNIRKIEEEGGLAGTKKHGGADSKKEDLTPYESAVYNLRNSLYLYQRLKTSLQPEDATNFTAELNAYAAAKGASAPTAEQTQLLATSLNRYTMLDQGAYLRAVAPRPGGSDADWLTTGSALDHIQSASTIPIALTAYAAIGDAFRSGDRTAFKDTTNGYLEWTTGEHTQWLRKTGMEHRFNHFAPFYKGIVLYIGAFLLACASWMICPKELRQAAFFMLVLAFTVQSGGMIARMWLQGRPPVTNLYSSALMVGWGAVFLAIFLEWFFRYGVALATAALVGFVTLIIAHHLSTTGDTMEMMQAVLDDNIWLATHVVIITLGYSAMFLAGVLAVAYVVLGLFTRMLTREVAKALTGMVYGVVCFATLFSFVGTVLGGIWGDQSWGRFWGWDPKENGALLIVLWCAMILHARWGGFIRQRGLMAMVIFGNAITAFSWFGVNMLNVGLHSYGFMEAALPWLITFVALQVALILLSRLPSRAWASFRNAERPHLTAAGFALPPQASASTGADA